MRSFSPSQVASWSLPLSSLLSSYNLITLDIKLGISAYGLGAYIFGKRLGNTMRPDIFGYHEIFHALTVVAAICSFLLIESLTHNVEERCQMPFGSNAVYAMTFPLSALIPNIFISVDSPILCNRKLND